MASLTAKARRYWRRTTAFLRLNVGHISLFVAVNLICGAIGIWFSLAAGHWISGSIFESLVDQFDNAGPYTFAIAFLASSASYVGVEYLDMKRAVAWRQLKMVLTLSAIFLIVACGFYSALQTLLPQNEASSRVRPAPTSVVEKNVQEVPSLATKREWPQRHVMQAWLVSLAFINGCLIFVTFRALAEPMKKAMAEIDEELDEEVDALLRQYPKGRAAAGENSK